jgi:hypothetical protein
MISLDMLNRRRLLRGLPGVLAALTVVQGDALFAQPGATAATPTATTTAATAAATTAVASAAAANAAPDPRAAEEQRRLTLSRRRRVEETRENAQLDQLLTATNEAPVTGTAAHRQHRPPRMHRNTTAQGRQAARPPPVQGLANDAATDSGGSN